MLKIRKSLMMLFVIASFSSFGFSQQTEAPQKPAETKREQMEQQQQKDQPMMGAMGQGGMMGGGTMEQMMSSISRTSDMCQMMMQQHMMMSPFRTAGYVFLGALLAIVLVLLAILEVQWIRYWTRRLKAQS